MAAEMRSSNLLRLTEWWSQDLTLGLLKKQAPIGLYMLFLS